MAKKQIHIKTILFLRENNFQNDFSLDRGCLKSERLVFLFMKLKLKVVTDFNSFDGENHLILVINESTGRE